MLATHAPLRGLRAVSHPMSASSVELGLGRAGRTEETTVTSHYGTRIHTWRSPFPEPGARPTTPSEREREPAATAQPNGLRADRELAMREARCVELGGRSLIRTK